MPDVLRTSGAWTAEPEHGLCRAFVPAVPSMLTSFIPRATGQKLKVRFLAGTRDQSMLSHP